MQLRWAPIICVILGTPLSLTKDLFNSVEYMEEQYRKEGRLLSALQEAIAQQQARLEILVQRYNHISAQRQPEDSFDEYIGHPIDAFTLIRRLTKEWPVILNLMTKTYEPPNELVEEMLTGGGEAMQSAVRSLFRLQKVYDLDADELVDGRVVDVQAFTKLTASDCMELVQFVVQRHEFITALSWVKAAARLVVEGGDLTVPIEQVASYSYTISSLVGCEGEDFSLPETILPSVESQFMSSSSDVILAELRRLVLYPNCSWFDESKKRDENDMTLNQHELYNEMCRRPSGGQFGLQCHYVHYHNPELLIAPFKLEELHISPPVVLFHDVISDSEIHELQQYFYSVKSDCEVLGDQSALRTSYRTCSRGWVNDAFPLGARLTRRVGLLSNMDMGTSEEHQVVNYGLSGEYKLHYDALSGKGLSEAVPHGNRQATVMFYLNDVTRGGNTIFPDLKMAVAPIKGTAILWFNLNYNSEFAHHSYHGACPVLVGQKWVATKWIHEGGQAFIRNCPRDMKYPVDYFYL